MSLTKTEYKNSKEALRKELIAGPSFFCPLIKAVCNSKCINSTKPYLDGADYVLVTWSCNNHNIVAVEE